MRIQKNDNLFKSYTPGINDGPNVFLQINNTDSDLSPRNLNLPSPKNNRSEDAQSSNESDDEKSLDELSVIELQVEKET